MKEEVKTINRLTSEFDKTNKSFYSERDLRAAILKPRAAGAG